MRVLHLADLHIYLSGPRAEECRRIIDWIAGNAKDAKPDVVVISGDIFERRSAPAERLYFSTFVQALRDIAPVYIINGNHDDRDDLRLFQLEYGFTAGGELFLEPAVCKVEGGLQLAMLPWPELGYLAANSTESIAVRRDTARAALVDVLRGLRQQIKPGPSLLLAHLSVVGAAMDSGQPVCGGEEIALTVDELLESGAAGVALGHIHLRQEMRSLDDRPVWYAGAPFRGSFGEAKGTKGGLIWDWTGKAWKVTPWEAPARSMILIEYTWTAPEEKPADEFIMQPWPAGDDVRDADIRVRITFPAEFREAMRESMAPAIETLKATAHMVVVEERAVIISRTRCVEIAAARTTTEKLHAWAQAVGAEIPDGADAKLGILEGVVL